MVFFLIENDKPTSYEEAISSKDAIKWRLAMKYEMHSIYQNKVWSWLDLPDGVLPIECKRVFKEKHVEDGNVHFFMAKLAAKGFEQVHDMNYDETRSPV
ncbi:hypothetical protein LIER_30517 [Lithospermum erythrorhizon]|uniref:Reverse transcriptase Ty1/copia-type domain-containing protein n=1 Tax=Lithospermum erythrorhizon TaxID=34254 RepID=A0AAV3RT50_LITER